MPTMGQVGGARNRALKKKKKRSLIPIGAYILIEMDNTQTNEYVIEC